MSDHLLEVRDLRKSFRVPGPGKNNKLYALDGISLDLARGETLGLVGESGCGKSTLARTLLMLERPDSGTVTFDGIDPFSLRDKELLKFRGRVQMVFQDPYASLNARMSAGDIIAEPWRTHKTMYTSRRDRETRVRELLDLVGLGRQSRRQVPAGVLRRATPADRNRPCPRAQPRRDHLRRAGLRTGPVGAGAGAQPAQRPAAAAGHLLHLHLARPFRGATRRRPGGGDVPRPHHRNRAHRSRLRSRQPSLHRRTDVGRAETGCGATRQQDPAQGRSALAAQSAVGLPVPDPVLEGHRDLRHHRAAGARSTRGSSDHSAECHHPLQSEPAGAVSVSA